MGVGGRQQTSQQSRATPEIGVLPLELKGNSGEDPETGGN